MDVSRVFPLVAAVVVEAEDEDDGDVKVATFDLENLVAVAGEGKEHSVY